MYALPVIQKDQAAIFKSVSLIGSPLSKLLVRTQRCIDEVLFLEKEAIFLSWIVFKSQNYSNPETKEDLISLHQKLLHFRNQDLLKYLGALRQQQIKLTAQSNCRYPPTNFADSYKAQGLLDNRFDDLCGSFKILKMNTFEMVEDFLTVSIY
ncbi:MAG: hypothetical protein IPL46_04665 [Saprospiraceae bacterium]|nr:hypothetical protein [Saprospiraceae bacterium]